jgi:tetratricopeptide (TPR) repeat protein
MAGTAEGSTTPSMRALCLAHDGRRSEAQALLTQLLDQYAVAIQEDVLPTQLLTLLLETAVVLQDKRGAAVCSEPLRQLPPIAITNTTSYSCPTRLLGAAAALLGKADEARELYGQALEILEKARSRPEIALTRLGLAELLLEHYPDERAAAIEHLDFAIGEFRDMKMQPSLERALRHRGLLKA